MPSLVDTRSATDFSPRWRGMLLANTAAWSAVTLLHTVASYGDLLRRGGTVPFTAVLWPTAMAYLPWLAFSLALSRWLRRRPGLVADAVAMRRLIGWSLPLFLLPEVAYQVALSLWQRPEGLGAFWSALRAWSPIFWLIDIALLVATVAVVYASVAMLENVAAERRRARADAELAAARTEVAQHRLRSLRAQLEPHFLFNTLNAISGLVRDDVRALAVQALSELSALLRYALDATQKDWVTVEDELRFVERYLALQRLRYGPRLQVQQVVDDAALAADCPPLLLQPLVENAIRHDVDRHDGISDIRLHVRRDGARVYIEVRNRLRPGAPPNPGAGLGLRATRDRLQLIYGEAATASAGAKVDQFIVTVTLPVQADV